MTPTFDAVAGTHTIRPSGSKVPPEYLLIVGFAGPNVEKVAATGSNIPKYEEVYAIMMTFPDGVKTPPLKAGRDWPWAVRLTWVFVTGL